MRPDAHTSSPSLLLLLQGKFAYAVGSDGRLRCFSTRSGEAEASPLRVSDKEMLGVVHHPFRNIVATFGKEGEVRLWAP